VSARGPRFPLPLERVAPAAAPRAMARTTRGPLSGTAREASGKTTREGTANAPPTARGLGLDSPAARERMVSLLRADGIGCESVLAAMAQVPRHAFVDAGLAAQAYENTALPIGHGQTISQPWVVARMIALLFERWPGATRLGRVLEIGTGCGYQAAVLAALSRSVVSVERLRALFDRARDNLAPLGLGHLRLVYGDGRRGHAPNAPYDAIICAAGGEEPPAAWLDQLAVGGRLVAPVRDASGRGEVLISIDRDEHGWSRHSHEAVRFVPLRSGTA
jgi:protein-L-isoaspartate(D-aspartate) O-methyltransferase